MTEPVDDSRPGDDAVALTIAGSDSGGGAGAQADLKTFAACDVFGTSVLTLITAQNTQGVDEIEVLGDELVCDQYDSVMDDMEVSAAKTGALGEARMIRNVAGMLRDRAPETLVVDPVMISKHGQPLMAEQAFSVMRERMLPRADVVTPNRFEAAALADVDEVESLESMKDAARRICEFGADYAVVKGGHFEDAARDVVYDGSGFVEFEAPRIETDRLHGSGCVFSSAITARLARGDSVLDAIGFAREFITEAIRAARGVGQGVGPVNPTDARRE